jgi:signal transduction histidine kinase
MSLTAGEPVAVHAGQQVQRAEIEPRKSAPGEKQSPVTNGKSVSIARRSILAMVAGQIFLLAGMVLVAAVYADVPTAIYAGLAGLIVTLAADLFAVRAVRRALDPLRELAKRADEISSRNWNLRAPVGVRMVTEISPVVEALDAGLARLQAAFRHQRDFTSDAAHELKTSAAIIKSGLQLLLRRPRTQREYEIGLEELLEDCARLEDLLERMLRLARIEQLYENGVRPKSVSVDLKSTCEAALSHIRTLAEERNVTLDLETSDSISLLADSEDLELIWMNLLENAVNNGPPGSTVKMRVRLNGNALAQVAVLDSGPGIPPAEIPYIFERFRRGDGSTDRSTCGFGLGLAICKALVDAYGGKIEAMNLPEHGAEFRVDLPLQQF